MAKRVAPTGLCFPYARTAMRQFGDDAEVVHARINMPNGRRGAHAWIEHKGRVYDWQNTEQRGETIPIKTFYAVTRPTAVKRYTPEEVLINCTRQGNSGPWAKSWRGGREQGWTFKGSKKSR